MGVDSLYKRVDSYIKSLIEVLSLQAYIKLEARLAINDLVL